MSIQTMKTSKHILRRVARKNQGILIEAQETSLNKLGMGQDALVFDSANIYIEIKCFQKKDYLVDISVNKKRGNEKYKHWHRKFMDRFTTFEDAKQKVLDFLDGKKILRSISKDDFRKLHKNYKTRIDGKPYILQNTLNGTCLVPVEITN